MQQERNRMDGSNTMVNAGGNVVIGQYDRIIMVFIIAVVFICIVNVIGYCVVVIHIATPQSLPISELWMNVP